MPGMLNSHAVRRMVQTAQQEHPTVDFKVALHLDDRPVGERDHKIRNLKDVRQAELARDMMALANLVWPSEPVRYILIGIDDHARIVGIERTEISETAIRDAVDRFCEPRLNYAFYFVEVDGCWVGVIEIPDSLLKPHRMRKRVSRVEWRDKQRKSAVPTQVYRQGTVYTRHGSHVKEATAEEEEQMRRYVANQATSGLAGELLVKIEQYIAERQAVEPAETTQSWPELRYPVPSSPPLVPDTLQIGQRVRLRLLPNVSRVWADPKGVVVEILGRADGERQMVRAKRLTVVGPTGRTGVFNRSRWSLCVPSYLIDAEWREETLVKGCLWGPIKKKIMQAFVDDIRSNSPAGLLDARVVAVVIEEPAPRLLFNSEAMDRYLYQEWPLFKGLHTALSVNWLYKRLSDVGAGYNETRKVADSLVESGRIFQLVPRRYRDAMHRPLTAEDVFLVLWGLVRQYHACRQRLQPS